MLQRRFRYIIKLPINRKAAGNVRNLPLDHDSVAGGVMAQQQHPFEGVRWGEEHHRVPLQSVTTFLLAYILAYT